MSTFISKLLYFRAGFYFFFAISGSVLRLFWVNLLLSRPYFWLAVAAHLRGMRPTLTERKAIQCLEATQNIYKTLNMTLLCILTVVHIYGYVYIRILNNAHKYGYVFIRNVTDPD